MRRAVVILTGAMLLTVPAAATPLEDRLREQLQATVTQLRTLQASQATLEAAKAGAEKERDALKAKASGPAPADTRALAEAKSQASALGTRLGSANAALATASARVAELSTSLAAAQAEIAQQRSMATAATARRASSETALKEALDRNARLVIAGRELVALHKKRYRHGDFPPLQLLRTRIENEAQAAGDRINADAIVVNTDAGSPK